MAESINEKLDNFRLQFENFEKNQETNLNEEDFPKSKYILSNSKLLINTLIEFYKDENKANYFPQEITSSIISRIQTMLGFLSLINATPASKEVGTVTAINDLLKNLDSLYTYSLQYGLITFGFTQKELLGKLQDAVDFQNKIKNNFDKTQEMVAGLERNSKNIKDNDETAKGIVSVLADHKEKVSPLSEEVQKVHKEITEEKRVILDEKTKVLALVKEIGDLKDGSKNQFEKVSEFFSEIEKYKSEMIDVKKESNANINSLKEKEDQQVIDFTTRTNSVIVENEKLQRDINDHLQKAVSISLFKSFDARTAMLKDAREQWMKYLTGSVVLAIAVGMWIFWSVSNSQHLDVVFFARFVLAFPVGYFVYFCGKQYGNERRAEEEYAFKSAVSLSLESYLDLIKRKGGDEVIGVGYVKNLINEIFDNPVKRLYFEEEGKKELLDMDLIFKNIEKLGKGLNLTADEAQKLAESLKRIIKLT